MAFLFKSKKHQQGSGLPPASRNVQSSEGPPANPSPNPSAAAQPSGAKERDGSHSQTPTPSSSYNNSLNSLNGTNSPDHPRMRQRAESESQSQRPQQAAPSNSPNGSPGASLYPWSQRRVNFTSAQTNPFPRYGAAINAVASKEGDIYMMGGLIDGSTVKGDLWMMENSGGNLSCFPIATVSEGPGPRVGHASLLVGNAFIVFGGDTKVDETDTLDDTLYLLNTSSRQWSRSIPPGPRPAGRYGHTLNILGSRLYVFGGQVEGYFFNDLVCFDLNQLQNPGNKWEFLIRNSHEGGPPPGQIPPARTNHTIVSFNDKLYLFGGTNGLQWFNDVWSYDPRANTWTQLDCVGFIPTPREGHAAALVNDVMYIFGGRTDEGIDLGDLAAFRISTRRWYSFQNMGPAPSPRSGHSMTAFGKQIIVLAGEPSSAPRDPVELSMAYILDTAKIRYPAENQSGERAPIQAMRKMSGDRAMQPTGRTSRESQNQPDAQRRGPPPQSRESIMTSPTGRPADLGPSPGPGSRLPRASIAQAPAGPPPPGQAPTPGQRGNTPQNAMNPRSKTPTKTDRAYGGPPVDTARAMGPDRDRESPAARDSPKEARPAQDSSAASGGRRTPTQQPSRMSAKAMEAGEAAPLISAPTRQRSLRQHRQRSSMDSADESILGKHASIDGSTESRSYRNSRSGDEPRSPRLTPHQEALIKELEAVKSRNAWYASELALAKKAGYAPNPANSVGVDERAADAFADEDRPLIEAFLAMRAELAKMQATVDRQAAIASKRVAEVEHQRDVAVNEAAYSRAKLAAHGGSQRGTPQPDGNAQESEDTSVERGTDLTRRLAMALASQNELKSKLEVITTELDQEKRGRELAEETCEATRRRLAELEMHNSKLEAESLRAELHQLEASLREESLLRSEADSAVKQLSLDKEELLQKLEDSSTRLRDYGTNLGGLREAVTASSEKSQLLERQLDEERERREGLERKLLQLRSEHEERSAELENATRRLRDAEELMQSHSREAETHKNAFLLGLERASSFDSEASLRSLSDQRVSALEAQIERANQLAKTSQAAADEAADKLRRAEERIAGLEAYQEQASREGLQLRRQLQTAMKESQGHSAENRELKSQLENHQREAGALAVQHAALKDLLGERGVNYADSRRSPLESPGSRFGTPEQGRLRELEQQLSTSLKAHEELKSSFETREQEADRAYREKLEQLENDYQSAVHYVKGTEKMLKRMKDELARYKSQNGKLQSELDAAQTALAESSGKSSQAPADWEVERSRLEQSISDLQEDTAASIANLESQVARLRAEAAAAEADKTKSQSELASIKQELAAAAEKSRSELEQLKQENALLENRASDAEQKVTMLLDQVEASVGHYRRQSQPVQGINGISRTHSNASSNTIGAGRRSRADSAVSQDDAFPDNRNSVALDSLANELEALRTQWESNNRNYRLSTQSDFDRTPTRETGLSDSLAEWRRRLDDEETSSTEKIEPRHSGTNHVTASMS
ncbi:negative regulator of mitotic exit [Aspergillus tubingensis]|uniref:putative cell polarity protein (Tea1) n=1 Tax=Aspergillus tubingensis TaxID=5068 RepID=UPI001578A337|nr:cell polarity protein [Aspergillus tubingensis]GFN17831.1 cell polarity protein [Aspergillus tubingensis]GLA67937.1 negative regulator of mitotic exit [Aspergillus tubingensis]GLB14136.1 negative regulator of mitotic exit [Aspergillus tubingensis]